MTIIDAWMQHPNEYFLEQPMFDSLKRWVGELDNISLEMTVDVMDEAKVTQGMLCAWHRPGEVLISNEEVFSAIQKYPDRFIGVASVNLFKVMDGVRELRKCVREYGFKALRIIQWLWELPCTHALYYPLYAECEVGNSGLFTGGTYGTFVYVRNGKADSY